MIDSPYLDDCFYDLSPLNSRIEQLDKNNQMIKWQESHSQQKSAIAISRQSKKYSLSLFENNNHNSDWVLPAYWNQKEKEEEFEEVENDEEIGKKLNFIGDKTKSKKQTLIRFQQEPLVCNQSDQSVSDNEQQLLQKDQLNNETPDFMIPQIQINNQAFFIKSPTQSVQIGIYPTIKYFDECESPQIDFDNIMDNDVRHRVFTIDIPVIDSIIEQSDEDQFNRLILLIFSKDISQLKVFLDESQNQNNDIINMRDYNGNTPLLLALKLSFKSLDYQQIVKILIFYGADPCIKDNNDYSPLEQALAQMNMKLSYEIFTNLVNRKQLELQQNRWVLDQQLQSIDDFYLEIKWEFTSTIIPFFNKMAPSDTFKIYKRGSSFRLDYQFAGIKNYKTKKMDCSIIYNPMEGNKQRKDNISHCQFLVVLNRSKQHYYYALQKIDEEEKKLILIDLMNCDSINGQIKLIKCELQKSTNIFGNHIICKIGKFPAQKYNFNITTEEMFLKKKHKPFLFTYEQYQQNKEDTNPLQQSNFNIGQSIEQLKIEYLNIPKIITQQSRRRKKKFPLRFEQFLPLIKILGKGNPLLQMMEQMLDKPEVKSLLVSEGFPVKLEIPINFSILAETTFQAYRKLDKSFDNGLFQIPENLKYETRKEAQQTLKSKKQRLLLAHLFI